MEMLLQSHQAVERRRSSQMADESLLLSDCEECVIGVRIRVKAKRKAERKAERKGRD